jgi:hypothetical protein
MILRKQPVPNAMRWIIAAEQKYGMYSPKASAVRRYFIGQLSPEFKQVPVPQELTDLGYSSERETEDAD